MTDDLFDFSTTGGLDLPTPERRFARWEESAKDAYEWFKRLTLEMIKADARPIGATAMLCVMRYKDAMAHSEILGRGLPNVAARFFAARFAKDFPQYADFYERPSNAEQDSGNPDS